MKVRLAAQVVAFVGSQAPEPRRKLRVALRALAHEKGDMKPLEGALQDYWRLRLGSYRVIFKYAGPRTIECVFAERRNIIYEVFAETMRERLARDR